MATVAAQARSIAAPPELGLETRRAFREAAVRELGELADGGTLAVDLRGTVRVDSAGLSTLMLIQRDADERGQRVVLRDPSDEMRFLLALTRLTDLFVLEPPRA